MNSILLIIFSVMIEALLQIIAALELVKVKHIIVGATFLVIGIIIK